MGRSEDILTLPENVTTVGGLMQVLTAREPSFGNARLIRAAVNQDFALPDTPIGPGDEIAFFPPVTGG